MSTLPCSECGGDKWTGGGYRPHAPDCSRNPKNVEAGAGVAQSASKDEAEHRVNVQGADVAGSSPAPGPVSTFADRDDRPLGPRVSFDDPDAATFPKERRQSLSEWRRQGGAADYSPSDYNR